MKAIIWDFNGTLYNPQEAKLFAGASKILNLASKKYKQALASTSFHPEERIRLIKSFGIWEYFDRVDIGLKTKKTFLDICREFKCSAEDVYVIGDNVFSEIRLGNKLGMKTIFIERNKNSSWKDRLFRKKYWKKISDLSELVGVLSNLKS